MLLCLLLFEKLIISFVDLFCERAFVRAAEGNAELVGESLQVFPVGELKAIPALA